jgi:hypothetical protein
MSGPLTPRYSRNPREPIDTVFLAAVNVNKLIGLLVERVVAVDRQAVSVEWTPPAARSSDRRGDGILGVERAVWDSNPRHED